MRAHRLEKEGGNMLIFWSLLALMAIIKGFEVAYAWQYMRVGEVALFECLKYKKFIVSAAIALLLYTAVALLGEMSLSIIIIVDLATLCMLVSLTDIKYKQIPNILVFLLLLTQLLMLFYQQGLGGLENVWWCMVVLMVTISLSLLFKGQIGMGDVKLLAVMCITLGLSRLIWLIIVALLIAFVIGLYMMIFQKKSIKTEMAFAPFLTLSLLVNLIVGGL